MHDRLNKSRNKLCNKTEKQFKQLVKIHINKATLKIARMEKSVEFSGTPARETTAHISSVGKSLCYLKLLWKQQTVAENTELYTVDNNISEI